jgi:hypothetical protein
MRHDSVLTRPARAAPPSTLVLVLRRLRAFPLPGYAGAALTAVLTGIVVNALTLQHQRHPAPFFAPHPIASVAAPAPRAPLPAAPSAPQGADDAPAAVLPPERPASLSAVQEPTPPRRSDAIGEILREEATKESSRSVLAAQSALIRLGYQLRADGVANAATQTALREFERAHGLPVSTELTPRLLRHLALAAAAR